MGKEKKEKIKKKDKMEKEVNFADLVNLSSDELVTRGQCYAIVKLIGNVTKYKQERLFILSELIDRKVDSTKEVYRNEWQYIRNNAYPNWETGNWTMCQEYLQILKNIKNKYEKEVLGQTDLFSK